MKTIITFQDKQIPVFYSASNKRVLPQLMRVLEVKFKHGKNAIKQCLNTLISIEIVGSEAILHTKRESDTLALSIY